MVIWFTGLSGSGKTTLATLLEKHLEAIGHNCCLLDGDVVRKGLNRDLGFSDTDHRENIRRIGEVSKLMIDSGLTVIAAFVSPYEADRKMVRDIIGRDFKEVYVNCSVEVCEQRDTKGLYKKARAGEIKDFTGIGAAYEAPKHAEVIVNTAEETIDQSLRKIIDQLGLT